MPIRDEDGHRAMQAAGKAWKAIKTSGVKTWREWTEVIGPGLVKARAEAQSISNASCGKGYNAAMGALLNVTRGFQFFTPLMITALGRHFGLGAALSVGAIFSVAAAAMIWMLPETRGRSIVELDGPVATVPIS